MYKKKKITHFLPGRDREVGNNSALEWWIEDQTTDGLETLAVDTDSRFSFHLVTNFYILTVAFNLAS